MPPTMPSSSGQRHPAQLNPLPGADQLAPLPSPLAPFVGRARELAALRALVVRSDARLVTLVGPGGVGKSRLGLRAAADAADRFADGTAFVPLAPVTVADLVVPAIARAVGVRDVGDQPLQGRLIASLRGRRLLLLLDNVEHLLEASPAIAAILEACPQLAILATSRTPLAVYGERSYPVQPLAVPPDAREVGAAMRLTEIAAYDAVRLFVERAQAVRPDFGLNEANAADVAAICRWLEGLPLAIELAAVRLSYLSLADLRGRLERRLPLLTGGPRDHPTRLRTMRNAIAWSHDLLTPAEQRLFRRLAIFVGGFSLEGAEWMSGDGSRVSGTEVLVRASDTRCPPADTPSILDGVAALVRQSMVLVDASDDRPTRYSMLESIREYGLQELAAHGEDEGARQRLAAYLLALAERAEPELLGPRQGDWLDQLDREFDNLRAALAWGFAHGDPTHGLRLAAALCWFWIKRVHLTTGREWIERGLAAAPAAPSVVRVKALVAAGSLAVLQGDVSAAIARHEAAVAGARALREPRLEALAMTSLGGALLNAGNPEGADWLAGALALQQAEGDAFGEALALVQLGIAALAAGEGDRAVALCDAAVTTFRAVGDWWFTIYAQAILGSVWLAQGAPARARIAFVESATLARQQGERWLVHQPLVGLALVASAERDHERAVRLLGASEAAAVATGGVNAAPYRAAIDRALDEARSRLGAAAFGAAWTAGLNLPLAAAIDDTLASIAATEPTPSGCDGEPAKRLTARERDVLLLLVEGRSDKEIAAALFVSPRTATTHVTSILGKLGVSSRTAAAAVAVRRGLA